MESQDGLSPRIRERLQSMGSLSDEERMLADEGAEIDTLLRSFYQNEINADDLLERLKAFEREGRFAALRLAQDKLRQSFKWPELKWGFVEGQDGSITMEEVKTMAKDEEQTTEGTVLELTDSTFDTVVNANSVLVVDCWAVWCGPCRMVAPVIDELAKDFAGKVTFGKLDVDKNPATARKFQIQSIPTILFFKNGKLVDQKLGAMPKAMLEPIVAKHVAA